MGRALKERGWRVASNLISDPVRITESELEMLWGGPFTGAQPSLIPSGALLGRGGVIAGGEGGADGCDGHGTDVA